MKFAKIALALAAMTLFVVPGVATAGQKHLVKKCPTGKHRNGPKCVKNRTAGARNPGKQGGNGPTGPTGSPGNNGGNGSPGGLGPEGKQGPQGNPAPKNPVAYDDITPESRIDNPVSLGYAATGTTEFGSQIAFGREGGITNPSAVEVLMSVWTCEQGEWNSGCVTTNPAATFAAPLTLNIYEVGSENEVGDLITSTTKTFNLHFRPTTDPSCSDGHSFKASDGVCQHGSPQSVSFGGITAALPHRVIVSIAYDPTGPLGTLNVALEGVPSIGSNPVEPQEVVYWDTQWYPTPPTSPNGVFQKYFSPEEWPVGESQLAVKFTE
jgi:hypothetical protein